MNYPPAESPLFGSFLTKFPRVAYVSRKLTGNFKSVIVVENY